MRIVPSRWHTETWICSLRGHVAPGSTVERLRPEDARLAVEVGGRRFSRCLRCDTWIETTVPPPDVKCDVIPPLVELDLPRRGRTLRDAVVLRLVAIERAIHCVGFTLLAITLALVESKIGGIRRWATGIVDQLRNGAGDHVVLDHWLDRLARLNRHEIALLLVAAIGYAMVEGVEAWALWTERRWGEYLTVVATAGFLPFEIIELTHRVTAFKVGAMAVNVAVLVWLVWAKHLFGVRGGESTIHDSVGWDAILDSPTPAPLA